MERKYSERKQSYQAVQLLLRVMNRKYELRSMRFVDLRNFIGEFFPFLLIIQATPPSMIKDIFLEIKQNLGIKPIKYNLAGLLSLLSQR